MDKTPKFTKMSDCPEIQGQWKPKWGDFVSDDGLIFPLSTVRIDKEDVIWLPRQDQLQEMVINFGHGHQNAGILFGLSLFSDEHDYNDDSMEQLWLAYVMYEKYGKVWDDKKEGWVK